jgi:elongation factor Ts
VAEITASLVKTLREQTGVGMMECKKALGETEGDLKKAVALLRERGAAKAVKRAGRATKEGKIQAKVAADGRSGALVEVNIETDFAARSERFVPFVDAVCDTVLATGVADPVALLAAKPTNGAAETIQALMTDAQTVIGENMGLTRADSFRIAAGQAGMIRTYIHTNGKVGVMIELKCDSAKTAQAEETRDLAANLCLQIAFSNPVSLDSSGVPAAVIEAEKSIYRNAAINEGKPEKMLDKIVDGRLHGFFKESCLVEQNYVKDEKTTVSALVAATAKALGGAIEIVRFARYQLGETARVEE